MEVRRKFAGLRFLAFLIKLTAWIILLASIALSVWFWSQGANIQGLQVGGQNLTGLLLLPIGIYTFIQLYVFGSILTLFTDVEYNTRANATATARLIKLVEKMERPGTDLPSDAISPAPPPPPPPPPLHEEPLPPTERIPAPPAIPDVKETQPLPPIEESVPLPPQTSEPSEEVTPPPTVEKIVDAVEEVVQPPVTKIVPPENEGGTD